MATGDGGEYNKGVFGFDVSDPNNSLLKKVTKRVSGLFPSSLTKWFGPSDGQQSVVRRRESIDEDDDDDDETAQLQQPPKKRAKPSSDVDFSPSNNFTITSTPLLNSRSDHRHLQPGPSGYTRHSTLAATASSVNYGASSTQNAITVTNGDDKSDSGDSTSGYSSVQPQLYKESSFISDRGNTLNQPSTSKTSPNKSLNASMNSSRSLFTEQSLNPQRQCMSARRPSFSASTFGSPSFVDRTLSTKRAVNSPFYSGRTMYGGASAYRRNRIIFPRDDTNNVSVKKSVDIKPVNEASSNTDSVNLSKTARRILDTLEHFSTPVLDAKKIPNINRQSCDASKSANQRRAPYLREHKSVPNKELLVPTVPDLIKMKLKERLQDSTVQVRKVATSSKSVLNTEYSIRTVEEAAKPQKHVSKMKTKVVSVRGRKEDDDTVDAVKLPEVKLPITDLPKFDFTLLPPATIVTKPTPTETKKPNISAPISKPMESLKSFSAQFNFAKPIVVSEKPKSATSINNFTFSEPINPKSSVSTNSSAPVTPTITFKASSSTAPRRKESPKANKQNNVGISLQPPNQFVSGSVMDILGKTENKTESSNLMDKFKPVTGTWECSACMVRNIPSATRCLACETLKETPKKIEEQRYGFGNKFKMTSDKWECSACMVRNNAADSKCVACTTPKPGAAPKVQPTAPVASTSNSFSGFGEKFKPAIDTWECTACMVRNKSDTVKCVACETPKPGNKPETKSSLIMPVEVNTNNSGFGDLIKKQQSYWECTSCMVRNPSEKKTCACCEAPKPGEQQEFKFGTQPTGGAQFKFGINNSAPSSGFKIDKSVAPTTFSFGIKPADKTTDAKTTTNNGPTPVTTGFTFGVPAASKSETKNESPAKSPFSVSSSLHSANKPITYGTPSVPTAEANKSTTFKYDSPVTTTSTNIFGSTTPTTIFSGYNTYNSFSVPSSITQTTPSKPTFSFGGASTTITSMSSPTIVSSTASIKSLPSTNIFGNATTAAPTTQTSTISFGATTAPAVTTPLVATSASSPSTFSFKAPPTAKPVAFGAENKIPVPQFNFGAGGLPFNPVHPTPKTAAAITITPTVNFGNNTTTFSTTNNKSTNKTETTAFGTSTNQATFGFNTGSNVTNNNKSEVKPFAVSGCGEPGAKVPAFSFSQNDTPTAAPLAKAPIFNFGASASNAGNSVPATAAPAANMFSFNPNKSEKAVAFGSGNSTVFGETAQSSTTPQNGGFNFGASSAPLSFNFGGGTNPPAAPTPAMFGFGSSQAGTGSAATAPAPAPAASASGIFSFGGGAPAQQQTPTFSPDIKPNFNFTGGSLPPTFSAQSAPSTGAMPQRKIRKAVRRTQPR